MVKNISNIVRVPIYTDRTPKLLSAINLLIAIVITAYNIKNNKVL